MRNISTEELITFLEHTLKHKYLTCPESEESHDGSGGKRILRGEGFFDAIQTIKELTKND